MNKLIHYPLRRAVIMVRFLLRWKLPDYLPQEPITNDSRLLLAVLGADTGAEPNQPSAQSYSIHHWIEKFLSNLPKEQRQYVVIGCVSGNSLPKRNPTTEAETLYNLLSVTLFDISRNDGQLKLQKLYGSIENLEPMPASVTRGLSNDVREHLLISPDILTKNTWENVQRILDYAWVTGIKRVCIAANHMHATYAWPLLLHAAQHAKARGQDIDELCLMNMRYQWYSWRSHQRRWLYPSWFYCYSVLAKLVQAKRGWCRYPYITRLAQYQN